MAMSISQAKANITYFYQNYVSRYPVNLSDALEIFELYSTIGGMTVEEAYEEVMENDDVEVVGVAPDVGADLVIA